MDDFNKCYFCTSYDLSGYGCEDEYCDSKSYRHYRLDVTKILNKADELNISVTDVLNLIHECNK